jgi:uncharacterized membrane protein (DUF485 family)
MAASKPLTPEEQVAYEKARYQYCLQIFNREEERREILEKKSQFYLSLVALFLGAIFFKPEFLDLMGNYLTDKTISIVAKIGLYISLGVLAVSLFLTMIAILKSMWLQKFKGEFPKNLFESIFDPQSKFIDEKNESGFYRATAMALTVALENNVDVNNDKSKWVRLSSYSIITGVFSLAILLGIFTFLLITN